MVPQFGQVTTGTSGAAHTPQKRAVSRFSWPQLGQVMLPLPFASDGPRLAPEPGCAAPS